MVRYCATVAGALSSRIFDFEECSASHEMRFYAGEFGFWEVAVGHVQ
jgi:hypothetical protein